MPKVNVTITPDLKYFVNDKAVGYSNLENAISQELKGEEGVVVLHVDKSVPVEHFVNVAGIATALKAKVSVATKPN